MKKLERKVFLIEMKKIHSLFHSEINPFIFLKPFVLRKGLKIKYTLNDHLENHYNNGYDHWSKIKGLNLFFQNEEELNLFFYGKKEIKNTEELFEFSGFDSFYKRKIRKICSSNGCKIYARLGSIKTSQYLIAALAVSLLYNIPYVKSQHLMYKLSEEPGKFASDKFVQKILNEFTIKDSKEVREFRL